MGRLMGTQLEHGKFYIDGKSLGLYFVQPGDSKVTRLPEETRYDPTNAPHFGLSSLHDHQIDVRQFQEVDALEYVEGRRIQFNDLVDAVRKYHPALQRADPVTNP